MSIVGIDGGSKRLGIAVSDELGLTAQPLATIARGDDDRGFISRLKSCLEGREIEEIVVGLPLRLDGSEGGAARAARRLARLLETSLGVPVELWDERLTSVQAERLLVEAGVRRSRRRGPTDRMAAAIMLQSYLDMRRSGRGGERP